MNCGDSTIDGLLNKEGHVPPLAPGANGVAVSYLQDLLRGHGYASLPDPRVTGYGRFGQVTSQAVASYRQKYGFPGGNVVDSRMLSDVVSRLAPAAVVGPAYVPLVLNAPFTPIARLPDDVLVFLVPSRYSDSDNLADFAWATFGAITSDKKMMSL